MPDRAQQKRLFEDFGYLVVRGALEADVGWISQEHARIFDDMGIEHRGEKRSVVVPFIDQTEKLCTLLDHPAIEGLLSDLLGDDFNYVGSDGNYYAGDTEWHRDGTHAHGKFLKLAIYLDPVTRETGALRVIPGSHRDLDWPKRTMASDQDWGLSGADVPAVALESQPGDVVVFNHNIFHASYGGSKGRRMLTMNCCSRARTPEEIQELRDYIAWHAMYEMEEIHSDLMRATAGPRRMVHLEQPMASDDHLPGLVAQRKRTGEAPLAVSRTALVQRS